MPAGGVAGSRKPGVWLSGTGVAFACSCPCGVETLVAFACVGRASTETAIAFARVGRASTETVIAFAGEKWVFFVRFSVAEVLSVSAVVVEGRAVVMAVSRWPASAAAEASLVSMSPRRCVPCAKKFALRRCRHREGTKKFAAPWCGPEAPHSHTQPHTVTHSHTQRIQKRPGPWPRALPATHELR